MKKLLTFLVIIAFVASFGGLIYYRSLNKAETKAKEAPVEVPVRVFKVAYKDISDYIFFTATIMPAYDVIVLPRVDGAEVKAVYVDEGDFVKKDQLLAELDTELVDAKLAQAKAARSAALAAVRSAKAQVEVLEKDYKRLQKLYKQKVIPKQKLDQIKGKYEAALASLDMARKKVKEAEAAIHQLTILRGYHRITAPVSGVISMRRVDPGDVVGAAMPIFKIDCIDKVKVIGSVPENKYRFVKKGMLADVDVDSYPDRKFKGYVKIVSPVIDPATRTATIEVHLDNKGFLLKPGMFARVKLNLGKRKALVIPRTAIKKITGAGGDYVFWVKDNKASLKRVELGVKGNIFVEVLKGLKEGDLVITTITTKIEDGTVVKIKEVENR